MFRDVSIPLICAATGLGILVLPRVESGFWFRRTVWLTIFVLMLPLPMVSSASIQPHFEQGLVKSSPNTRQRLPQANRIEPIPLQGIHTEDVEEAQGTLHILSTSQGEEDVERGEEGDPLERLQCMVTTGIHEGKVNLRQGPGMDYAILTVVSEGAQFPVLAETGDYWTTGLWRQVEQSETLGWLFAPLCKTEQELAGADDVR